MDSRLSLMRKQLGLRQDELALILGCSKQNISMIERGKSSLSERNAALLVKKFNLNPLWLQGESVPMLLPGARHASRLDNSAHPEGRGIPSSVPMFDLDAAPSLAELFRLTSSSGGKLGRRGRPGRMSASERSHTPVGWISIPGMPESDGALRLVGNAMGPILCSGDIVVYKQIDFRSEIFWGELYIISMWSSVGEYITVRYVRPSTRENHIILAGENAEFAELEVPLERISALALVKCSIRMNSAK